MSDKHLSPTGRHSRVADHLEDCLNRVTMGSRALPERRAPFPAVLAFFATTSVGTAAGTGSRLRFDEHAAAASIAVGIETTAKQQGARDAA